MCMRVLQDMVRHASLIKVYVSGEQAMAGQKYTFAQV